MQRQAAISNSDRFGYKGNIFITEFGTIAPVTHMSHTPKNASAGEVMGSLLGQKVVVVDLRTKKVQDFIKLNSVYSAWRPVGLQFSPDGDAIYITSIEKEQIRDVTPTDVPLHLPADWPYLKTGTIWEVTHEEATDANNSNNTESSAGNNSNDSNSKSSTIKGETGK